tara:strand:+ start:206 stop:901 length:696 start_codon:yes stop_codon:yes gene_type:complete
MILYSIGDSVTWGAELENKENERFSKIVADKLGFIDCNTACSGVSNDYIFRNTMRDIHHWIETHKCWSEEIGWIKSDELKLVIGWTSPTRFEWWTGSEYQQERLWSGYDKWGDNDKDKTTEDIFVLNQTELIPSYIRTFNYIQSLISICELNGIDYYFFNAFYKYENIEEPLTKIDMFGRDTEQLGLEYLKTDMDNMYDYLNKNEGTFHPRKHPTKESHKLWANYILNTWL